ncbi:MAG: hypothetical protein ACN4GG_01220 [Akkermansiaceae bacterium]
MKILAFALFGIAKLGMENPYEPPETDQIVAEYVGSAGDRTIARVAIWLYRAPMIASLLTLLLMASAFSTLAADNSAVPSRLAGELSLMLWILMIGLGLGLIGWVLALVSIFRPYSGRRPNCWSWIILSAVYAFFGFPVGTVCGLFLIGLVLKKWKQFFPKQLEESEASDH